MRLCWLGLCARLPQCVLEPWHCCGELKCQGANRIRRQDAAGNRPARHRPPWQQGHELWSPPMERTGCETGSQHGHAASAGAHHAGAVARHARGDPGRGGYRSLRRMVLPISPDGDKLLAWILRSILAADFERIVSAQLAGLDARRGSRLRENGSCGARGSLANRPGLRQRLERNPFMLCRGLGFRRDHTRRPRNSFRIRPA